jgi:flagellar biosynthetic protein FliR
MERGNVEAVVLPLAEFLEVKAVTFLLVLTRISGVFLFAPILSSNTLPRMFKFIVTFAMAILATSVVRPVDMEARTAIDVVIFLAAELLIGRVLGLMMDMSFQALQLAGQNAGNQLGLSLANVVNPQFDEQISTTSVVYVTVASLIFFIVGADREIFAALLETFQVIPLGRAVLDDSLLPMVMDAFREGMIFALRVSAPVTVSLLMAEIAMGFVGRTVPQLNVQSVGFSVRILLGITVTMVSLTSAGLLFHDELNKDLYYAYQALTDMVPFSRPQEQ